MGKMKGFVPTVFVTAVSVGVIAGVAALLRAFGIAISTSQILDVATGALCLVWLIVILKAPWDLFFEARAVSFDLKRSRELGIKQTSPADREAQLRTLARRLLALDRKSVV
jgi:hypothetical protein